MAGRSTVETLAQALAKFEMIGMPARNLAARTRHEYVRDLRDLLSYLERCGTTRLDEVRPHKLEGCLAELDRRGLQGSTCNHKVLMVIGERLQNMVCEPLNTSRTA